MAFELPYEIYSPELLESVVYELEQYLEWYRANRVRKHVGAKPSEEPTHSGETVLVIEAWSGEKTPTLESLEDLVAHLQKLQPPVIHLTMAALPNHVQREALVKWFRTEASPRALLTFVADRNLGGGVIVRTPNHMYDWSWRQQLLDGRARLSEIIKHV